MHRFSKALSRSSRRTGPRRGFRVCSITRNNIDVTVDGKPLSVPSDYTVLQACEEAGVRIPRFCFHERLSIAGNCRMCLVEVERSPKPVASCAMPLMPGMNIKTNTPKVHKAREGVVEFLLANHPLDCPICDQGGECDLQDQSMAYGSDRSRFAEIKRTVEDKDIGPLVKTIMTRCIHCTRCVRFAEEVAGVPDLGITGRGNAVEIGTYVEKPFDSEMSGNIIDLCPVGALTSKSYAFVARPWELFRTDTIDCFDALGSSIRIDQRSNEILRILPRLNEDINEEWLGDKSRFSADGFKKQRLDVPLLRKDGAFIESDWQESLHAAVDILKSVDPSQIRGIVGKFSDAESMLCFKEFLNSIGCESVESRFDNPFIKTDFRSQYLMGSTIAGVEDADMLLIVGSNPRMEAPVLNSRIRKSVVHNDLKVGYLGPQFQSTFDIEHLGDSLEALEEFVKGKVSGQFWKDFSQAKRPMILVGQSLFQSKTGSDFIYSTIDHLKSKLPLDTEDWNGINFLQVSASAGAAFDLGIVPGANASEGAGKVYILLSADDNVEIPHGAKVIYIGSHGDKGAERADVILPASTFAEKSGHYVNTEGRVQFTSIAVTSPGDAREDWTILRALSEVYGKSLPYESLESIRKRMVQVCPSFSSPWQIEEFSAFPSSLSKPRKALEIPLDPLFDSYFQTDAISRASKVMAKAAAGLSIARNSYVSKNGSEKKSQQSQVEVSE